MTVKVNNASPDLAACEHPRVNDVGANQGGFDAIHALRQQLVRQRLVEPDGSKFTGAVILGWEGGGLAPGWNELRWSLNGASYLYTGGTEEPQSAGDGHDVTVVLCLHVRKECLCHLVWGWGD